MGAPWACCPHSLSPCSFNTHKATSTSAFAIQLFFPMNLLQMNETHSLGRSRTSQGAMLVAKRKKKKKAPHWLGGSPPADPAESSRGQALPMSSQAVFLFLGENHPENEPTRTTVENHTSYGEKPTPGSILHSGPTVKALCTDKEHQQHERQRWRSTRNH